MAKILVADPLAEDGLERLRQAGEVTVVSKLGEAELIRRIPEFDALVVRSETRVTAPVIEAGIKLRVVGRAGVGVDNIDVSAATRKGILVVNAPRGNIIAAAEHTIALLFSLARWVPQADASVKRGEWSRAKFIGTEIRGKTLGVIGLGNVGSEVAKRAHGLEMDVIAYDPVVAVERAELFNVALVSLHELLERADFVTLHVPLVDSNRNLLGAAVGLNLAFEFLFSGLYHSKLTESMQFIDVAWIYVLLLSLIACAVQCVVVRFHDPARETERPVFSNRNFLIALAIAAGTVFIGIMMRVIRPNSTWTTIFLAGVLAVAVSYKYVWEFLSNRIQAIWPPKLLPPWHTADIVAVILIFAFGLPALVCRFSDGPDHWSLFDWCVRDEGRLQAHAVWHVTSAFLVLAVYDFFGHYFPEQGRVFANWGDD